MLIVCIRDSIRFGMEDSLFRIRLLYECLNKSASKSMTDGMSDYEEKIQE